jgi:hypothetical protein
MPTWLWLHGSWINKYLCNQCLSPLKLWVLIPLRWSLLNTTLCDKVCQWLATGWWFSRSTLVSSTNKTDRYDKTEILLKMVLNTIIPCLSSLVFHILITSLQMKQKHSFKTISDSARNFCEKHFKLSSTHIFR